MSDTLYSIYYRLSSDAYDLPAVLVELALIGLCVNWLAGVLHGTRGTRPLRGVLIILVGVTMIVRVLAAQFEWVRLDLLYSYVLYGLAFIGLVVFQPELRRAVIRVGDVRFRRHGAPTSHVVASLVKSAGFLSRNRYGALIAIQRGVDLTGWAENGTLIRAEVSANLLNSIFFPNSPLHDLGVILRENRIVAANCQFPSAESDEVDAALGSRHLAAVGMSYESDALVLVVSEETGVVSLADEGKLTRFLSLDDLADELTQRLARRGSREQDAAQAKGPWSACWYRFRKLLVALPLTAIIWYLADQATFVSDSVKLELDVTHDNPAAVVDIRGPIPVVLRATFIGPGRAMDRLRIDAGDDPMKISWTLPTAYEDSGVHSLSASEIQDIIANSREISTRGLSVAGTTLERLTFSVDRLVTLTVPVQVDGSPVRIAVERVDPPRVEVVVRASELKRLPLTDLHTIRAPLRDRLRGLTPDEVHTLEQVPLEERLGAVRAMSIEPSSVTVVVRVVGKTRTIGNVVVHLIGSPEVLQRYEIRKNDLNEWRMDVEVEGEEAIVDGLEPADIRAFAPVTAELMPAAGESQTEQLRLVEVVVMAPQGVDVIGTRSVRVTLVPRPGDRP